MRKSKILIFLIYFFSNNIILNAQCAMCKAVVETNLENGGKQGAGLNDGILYLMAMPYIAIFLFAIAYYLIYKRKEKYSAEL
tara:strand:- start:85 stop:330 length:246 start_codon:yes stop_codon:yes gene_type:complete